jgi:hypothetical protein
MGCSLFRPTTPTGLWGVAFEVITEGFYIRDNDQGAGIRLARKAKHAKTRWSCRIPAQSQLNRRVDQPAR